MKPLHFAPLQGYTTWPIRCIHARRVGGVTAYYTPFIRWEKGAVRRKDLLDILPGHNEAVNLVPQIIAGNVDEMERLCDAVQEMGYHRIDFNMGCPAPMQTKLGRGSALLSMPETVERMARFMQSRAEVSFSVKMRLGWKLPDEWREILPILHDVPLAHIALHPRVGIQQYKGTVDRAAFASFCDACRHPLLYNGDVQTLQDLHVLERDFPQLSGIMLGRALLGNPCLSAEYASGQPWDELRRRTVILAMHDDWLAFCREKYVSDAQVLLQVKVFWEYQSLWLDRKVYKRIMKSGSFRNYMEAVSMV